MTARMGDAVLVAAARRDDKAAFAELVARHYPLLLALCRRALADPHAAADAAQEAVLDAMLGLDRLRWPDRFGPWLAGIGLNVCRRSLRGRGSAPWSLEAMLGGRRISEPVDLAPGPDELAEAVHVARTVREAITSLPRGQRDAVAMYYLAGLTYAEVSAHLGTPVTAVKTRLHKARASLRRELAPMWKEQAMMTTTGQARVLMRVSDVRASAQTATDDPRHVVVLAEDGGNRTLMIWIGPAEALNLARALEGVELPRPSAYHLTTALLQASGRRLAEARITALTDQVFYAQAVLDDGSAVDARPSDALNLALLADAPIHVDPTVLTVDEHCENREQASSYPHDSSAIVAEGRRIEQRARSR